MLILSCDNKVPEEQQDIDLPTKLKRELPGVFNRMVKAWERLRERGRFDPPPTQASEMLAFTEENNHALQWVRDRTDFNLEKKEPSETDNMLLYMDNLLSVRTVPKDSHFIVDYVGEDKYYCKGDLVAGPYAVFLSSPSMGIEVLHSFLEQLVLRQ